jgi:serine phosphatase RsbU (regulator of sigma subunit)/ligand-binding sensor domain-containing protein
MKYHILKASLFFTLLFASYFSNAQLKYGKWDHITSESGFPAEAVAHLQQDSRGGFWAITDKGLMYYNGHTGKIYPPTSDSSGFLPSNPYQLYIDREQKIWISYVDSCISSFDPLTEKFTHYFGNSKDLNAFPGTLAATFYEDSKGRFWIPTWGGGLVLLDRKTGKIKRYVNDPKNPKSVSTDAAINIVEDTNGLFIVSTWEDFIHQNKLHYFNAETEEFTDFPLSDYVNYPDGGPVEEYPFRIVHFVELDDKNNLWIGTFVGLYYLDRQNKTAWRVGPSQKWLADHPSYRAYENIIEIDQAPDGTWWASSEMGGIFVVDEKKREVHVVKRTENGLTSDNIRCLYIDKNGVIYVAFGSAGIDVYDPRTNQFNIISNETLGAVTGFVQSANSIEMLAISPDNLRYTMTTGNGLIVYSFANGVEKRLNFAEAYLKEKRKIIQGIWNDPRCYQVTMLEDEWWINSNMGLIRYFPETQKTDFSFLYPYQVSYLGNDDSAGFYLIRWLPEGVPVPGTNVDHALYRYDTKTDQLTKVINIPDPISNVHQNDRPRMVASVKQNRVFYDFSPKKFLIVNPQTRDTTYYSPLAPYNNFPDSAVRALTTNAAGDLWLRGQNGIYLFDPVSGKNTNYTGQLHLKEKEQVICGVTDAQNNLWLGTRRALIKFDPITNESYRFDHRHGLSTGGFVSGFIDHQTNDTIVMPVNYGMLYFEPDKLITNQINYDIALSGMTVNRDTVCPVELDSFMKNPPSFKWNENFISFEFFTTQIYSKGQKTYSYRLIGLDSNWVDNGSQNVVHYSNLGSGDYVFEVYCTDIYGQKTPTLSFPFSIRKPFWFTWWFIVIEILLGLLIIYLFVQYRERHLRKTQERLENTVNERTQEVRDKMEEIETQKEIIEEKNKELTDSIKYAKRIQNTLLASRELLRENLPEHFIYFKPKDIVSGDFYWATNHGDSFYLAICDSTGHGVPGAFMSLLNIRFLNEAIVEADLADPGQILDYVRKQLILNLAAEGAKDGMDGTLIRFDNNSEVITYASAHNSPVLFRNNEPDELPADKMPVGQSDNLKPFVTHSIHTQKGDVIYFFTDGYPDQFGGDKGKKLKYKNFIQILHHNHLFQLDQQQIVLEEFLMQWKGSLEQLDDILVVGIKINT